MINFYVWLIGWTPSGLLITTFDHYWLINFTHSSFIWIDPTHQKTEMIHLLFFAMQRRQFWQILTNEPIKWRCTRIDDAGQSRLFGQDSTTKLCWVCFLVLQIQSCILTYSDLQSISIKLLHSATLTGSVVRSEGWLKLTFKNSVQKRHSFVQINALYFSYNKIDKIIKIYIFWTRIR